MMNGQEVTIIEYIPREFKIEHIDFDNNRIYIQLNRLEDDKMITIDIDLSMITKNNYEFVLTALEKNFTDETILNELLKAKKINGYNLNFESESAIISSDYANLTSDTIDFQQFVIIDNNQGDSILQIVIPLGIKNDLLTKLYNSVYTIIKNVKSL